MDRDKFICKKCSFNTDRLEKLNGHTKKIHVIRNSSNLYDMEERSRPQNGFCTRDAFDETLDVMESKDPPANIRFVTTVIITEPPKTKQKKLPRTSFQFMIIDATELSS